MKAFVVTVLSAIVIGGGTFYYVKSKNSEPASHVGNEKFEPTGNQNDPELATVTKINPADAEKVQETVAAPEQQSNANVIPDEGRSSVARVSQPAARFAEIAKSGDHIKTLEAARIYVKETSGSHAAKKAHLSSLLIAFKDPSLSLENKAQVWQELGETLDKEKAATRSISEYQLFARVGFAASEIHFKNDLSKLDAFAKSVDNKASENYGFYLQAAVANMKGDAAAATSYLETAIKDYPLPEYKRVLAELQENPQSSPFHLTLSLDDAAVQN